MSETLKNVAVFSGTACGTADPADKPASARLPLLPAAQLTPRLLLPLAALHAAQPTLTRSKTNFATPDSRISGCP